MAERAAGRRAPGRSLEAEENEIVRQRVRELVERCGNQTEVASILGIQQSAVSSFLRGVWSGGIPLAKAVARHEGVHLCELLGWHDADAGGVDPIAARRKAVWLGIQAGAGSEAIAALRRQRVVPGATVFDYLLRLMSLQEAVAAGKRSVG